MKDTIHFDAPEFYPAERIIMRVDGPHGLYLIVSEGERCVEFTLIGGTQRLVRSHESFRSNFPDGNLPEDSDDFRWINNGWFAVYEERSDEVLGEPMMSLAEAVTYALDLAYGEL